MFAQLQTSKYSSSWAGQSLLYREMPWLMKVVVCMLELMMKFKVPQQAALRPPSWRAATSHSTGSRLHLRRSQTVVQLICPPPAGGVWSIAMTMSVCLSLYSHNSKTIWPNLWCNVACGRGSVLLWRRCGTLYVLPVSGMTSYFHTMSQWPESNSTLLRNNLPHGDTSFYCTTLC